jgi:uncharacterized protein YjbI with pentapeptide repeats
MKIFVSHSSTDNELAHRIENTLVSFKTKCWIDLEQLKEGDELTRHINEGLEGSTHFLLIWTKNAKDSFWVTAEKTAAIERKGKLSIIVLKLDDTLVGFPLADFVRPDISIENLEEKIQELIEKIEDDFERQLFIFKKRVIRDYNNPPILPKKPIIVNFKKLDGAKFFVRPSYIHLKDNKKGEDDVFEYIIKSIRNNLEKIERRKVTRKKLSSLQEEIKKSKLDKDTIDKINLEKENFEKFEEDELKNKLHLDKTTLDFLNSEINLEKIIHGEVFIQKKITKIKQFLDKIESLRHTLEDLEEERIKLENMDLKIISSSEMISRYEQLHNIDSEESDIKNEINSQLEKEKTNKQDLESEIEKLVVIETAKKDLAELNSTIDSLHTSIKDKIALGREHIKNLRFARNKIEEIVIVQNNLRNLDFEKLIPIIGDYGSGKSVLCHHVLNALCENPDEKIKPIFIPLGQLKKHDDSTDHLIEDIFQYITSEYLFNITIEDFHTRIVNGEFIFILDALDEMSNKLDSQIAQNNLDHIVRLAKNCVVLMTSRHTYLSDNMQKELLVYDGLIKIQDFDMEQILKFLQFHVKDEITISEIINVLKEDKFADFSRKPLFLNVIYENFSVLRTYIVINESVILEVLTDAWIKHDKTIKEEIDEERKKKIITSREKISEILAFAEYGKEKPIGIDDITLEVKEELKNYDPDAESRLSQYYSDAITSTFLVNEDNQTYRFILRPIMEYFIARRIVNEIRDKKFNSLFTHVNMVKSVEIFDFIRGCIDTDWAIKPHLLSEISEKNYSDLLSSEQPETKRMIESISQKIFKLKSKENQSKELFKLIRTLGNKTQRKNVSNLVKILHISGNLANRPNLSELNLESVDLRGANLSRANLSETRLINANLSGANLSGANLSGAILINANLGSSNMQGANLLGTDLTDANMINSDLRNIEINNKTIFKNAQFYGSNINGLNFRQINLRESNFCEVDFTNVRLEDADLRNADLRYAKLNGIMLNKANLSDAKLHDADLTNADMCGTILRRAKLHRSLLNHIRIDKETDFSNAELIDADLKGVEIDFAIIFRTIFTRVKNLEVAIEKIKSKGGIFD